jgi:hypothetical protein
MDPTLDNMFGRPSSSHDGAGFDLPSPKHGERSDPIDLFAGLTNEPEQDSVAERSPFAAAFGDTVDTRDGESGEVDGGNAFEEGLEGAF